MKIALMGCRGRLKHSDPERDGRWIYGYYVLTNSGRSLIYQANDNPKIVYEDSVGRCTGLLDTNNRLIYEDDFVVSATEGDMHIKRVRWDAKRLLWTFGGFSYAQLQESERLLLSSELLTVVGNFHDDPELLF